jgi:hypothetical protein
MIHKTIIYLLVLLISVVTIAAIFRAFQFRLEGFDASLKDYKNSSGYKTQFKLVGELQEKRFNGRRDFNDMLQTTGMPAAEQCLVNFYSLGCRFTGYLGPFAQGYFDSDTSVIAALKMGCRTLVLEIDYYSSICETPYPRLAVRDRSGANVSIPSSDVLCQSDPQSNIHDVCASIAKYAFSNSVQNPADPLIIVLYLVRIPQNDGSSDYNKVLTNYYSSIAKGVAPLLNNAVNILAAGGNYSRQAQESSLLTNPISTYSGQVLFFCNADTSVYRGQTGIPTELDLDYIVNLRLTYTQNQFGITKNTTTNSSGNKFALLESVEGYMQIPNDKLSSIQASTNSTWTMCLENDPITITPQASTDALQKIGVHCIPIQIWSSGDNSYDYMFDKDHFGKYSFLPKPKNLRYSIPKTAIPAPAAPQTNANGGVLQAPTL